MKEFELKLTNRDHGVEKVLKDMTAKGWTWTHIQHSESNPVQTKILFERELVL